VTTKAGVGMSFHHSPTIAGHEAAENALEIAGISEPDFVFMFATVGYDQQSLLHAVREATGGAPLTGCSGEGTIGGEEADESNNSVVVMVISSDELRWTSGLAKGLSTNSRAVGQEVAQSLSSELGADDVGLTSAGFIPDSSRRAKVGIPDKRCATESVVVRKEEPM
jgi:hypothetical protein